MGVLMLIFALSAAGESGLIAVRFNSMADCTAARDAALASIKNTPAPSGAPVKYVAAVCVTPAEVELV